MAYKTFVNGFPLNASEINNNLMNQVISTFATEAARTSAISAPVEGQITYLESTEKFYKFDSSDWVELPGFESQVSQAISPNYIINGAFDVWQRGTSFSATNFTADRWVGESNGTATITRQDLTVGSAPISGLELQYFSRFNRSTGGSYVAAIQRIEDVRTLAGQTATLSFYAKASSAITVISRISQYFGSGGSTEVSTSDVSHLITTSWQRFSTTVSIPSISGKTLGSGNYLKLLLITEAEGIDFDLTGVQLEAGSVATPFKRHAPSLQGELAACQRYYQRIESDAYFSSFASGVISSSTSARILLPTNTTMRTTPSMTVSGSPAISTNGSALASSSYSVILQTGNGIRIAVNTSGASANQTCSWSITNGIVELSAEL